MSDYFEHVERGLRGAVRDRLHLPWYARVIRRRSRSAVLAVAILVGGGSAQAVRCCRKSGPRRPRTKAA
jgi:hypothetical protein